MTPSFQRLWEACERAARETEAMGDAIPLFNINPDTYRMWRAYSGNAKARRRYRRKHPERFRVDGSD